MMLGLRISLLYQPPTVVGDKLETTRKRPRKSALSEAPVTPETDSFTRIPGDWTHLARLSLESRGLLSSASSITSSARATGGMVKPSARPVIQAAPRGEGLPHTSREI